jgi:hypothetical protein
MIDDIKNYFAFRDELMAKADALPIGSITNARSERCRAAYIAGVGDFHFHMADNWLSLFAGAYTLSGRPWQPMLLALEVLIRDQLDGPEPDTDDDC